MYIYSNSYPPFLLHNQHKGSREESSQEQKDSEEGTHLQDAQKSGKRRLPEHTIQELMHCLIAWMNQALDGHPLLLLFSFATTNST